MCHQKKFQLNWLTFTEVTANLPASLYGLSPMGIAFLNKFGARAVKELSQPLTGRLTTSLKGFYALAAWEPQCCSIGPIGHEISVIYKEKGPSDPVYRGTHRL